MITKQFLETKQHKSCFFKYRNNLFFGMPYEKVIFRNRSNQDKYIVKLHNFTIKFIPISFLFHEPITGLLKWWENNTIYYKKGLPWAPANRNAGV